MVSRSANDKISAIAMEIVDSYSTECIQLYCEIAINNNIQASTLLTNIRSL